MLGWFVENAGSVVLVLIAVALGFLAALWLTRRVKHAVGAGIAAGLALLVWLLAFLLSFWIETDRMQIQRKVLAMKDAVEQRNPDQVFVHISEDFRRGSLDKGGFADSVRGHILQGRVHGLKLWEFEFGEVSRARKRGTLLFLVKGTGKEEGKEGMHRCRTIFVLDRDGQWRLQGFQLYDPVTNPDTSPELPMPF